MPVFWAFVLNVAQASIRTFPTPSVSTAQLVRLVSMACASTVCQVNSPTKPASSVWCAHPARIPLMVTFVLYAQLGRVRHKIGRSVTCAQWVTLESMGYVRSAQAVGKTTQSEGHARTVHPGSVASRVHATAVRLAPSPALTGRHALTAHLEKLPGQPQWFVTRARTAPNPTKASTTGIQCSQCRLGRVVLRARQAGQDPTGSALSVLAGIIRMALWCLAAPKEQTT